MRKISTLALVMAGMGAVVMAAPPGDIDGENIKTDFGSGNLVALQNNYTQFGDYFVTPGGFLPGSELDQLYMSRDADRLYFGLTGNLQTTGHAMVIFIDVPGRTGQTELRTEGVDGPPFTLQDGGREIVVSTNGTPEDDTDDTWAYGENGTTLPCEADYAIAIDTFGGTASVSLYELIDPATGTSPGTFDPTPNNTGDLPDAELWAIRTFAAQGATNDGNAIWEGGDFGTNGTNTWVGGFDNENVDGVTDTDGSTAATATQGLEIGIDFDDIGLPTGSGLINVFAAILDGGEEVPVPDNNNPTGTWVNQLLPALGTGAPCDPPGLLGLRPDLSAEIACLNVNVGALPSFVGVAEGDLSDPVTEGYALQATQTCPTAYWDQVFDPEQLTRGGGSELDALYVTDDGTYLYIGLTGNLQENGNKLNIWIDSIDTGTNGPLPWDNMSPDGMEGDIMPPLATNPLGPSPNYDYALSINIGSTPATVYADMWDINAEVSQYKGQVYMEAGNGDLDNSNPAAFNRWNLRVALNNLNDVGVTGTAGQTSAEVEADADTALTGFEIALPLAEIGVDPCESQDISIWAHITGGGGWRSNQALPPMREAGCDAINNRENVVTDWYDDSDIAFPPCGIEPADHVQAVAYTHTTTPSVVNDCNTNSIEDHCEVLDALVDDCNSNGVPDSCDLPGNDCNTNLIPDSCDIDSGFSQDLNTNGIPDECDFVPCVAMDARSYQDHGTRLGLDMGVSGGIEPRGGVVDLEIDVDDASSFAGGVTVSCTPAYAGTATGVAVDDTVTVTFSPALPDESQCTVTLDCGAEVCVRSLKGDVDRNGLVTTGDGSAVKPLFGQPASTSAATTAADQDLSGTVTTGDTSAIKPLFGHAAPACP